MKRVEEEKVRKAAEREAAELADAAEIARNIASGSAPPALPPTGLHGREHVRAQGSLRRVAC